MLRFVSVVVLVLAPTKISLRYATSLIKTTHGKLLFPYLSVLRTHHGLENVLRAMRYLFILYKLKLAQICLAKHLTILIRGSVIGQ